MDPTFDRYRQTCNQLGIDLTQEQYDLLLCYARLVRRENRLINLVSRKDIGRILTYHVVDSLAVQRLIPRDARVCDIGTGAGLPGIPLALVRPDIRMHLVESSRKRSLFLTKALAELDITNADVRNERAENVPPLGCDVVLSRLTAKMEDVLVDCAHHRKPGGTVVFYKNQECEDDLKHAARALRRLRLKVRCLHDVVLPYTKIVRRFLVIGSI